MPNGKPGDHPLTDILIHGLDVYGREADDLIRAIRQLCSRRELYEWWQREIGWDAEGDLVLEKARACHGELTARARDSGWEPPRPEPK